MSVRGIGVAAAPAGTTPAALGGRPATAPGGVKAVAR